MTLPELKLARPLRYAACALSTDDGIDPVFRSMRGTGGFDPLAEPLGLVPTGGVAVGAVAGEVSGAATPAADPAAPGAEAGRAGTSLAAFGALARCVGAVAIGAAACVRG